MQRPVDAGRMGANAVTKLGLLHVATATTAQLSRRKAAIVCGKWTPQPISHVIGMARCSANSKITNSKITHLERV